MVEKDARHQASIERTLTKIKHAQGDVSRATNRLTREVGNARAGGATWREIGAALGVTQQGAQKRYGTGEEREIAYRLQTVESGLKRAKKRLSAASETHSEIDPGGSWPDGTTQGTIDAG